jgi:ubiquinone/menaquinone biosynthesis C-methylase UbiE
MMTDDPKSIVANGYDLMAKGYLERYGRSSVRDQWLEKLINLLRTNSRVLDLGGGSGIPVTRELTRRGFNVVVIDGAAGQTIVRSIECSKRAFHPRRCGDVFVMGLRRA